MANIKLQFNETKYKFVLDAVIPTETDEVRERYHIYINGKKQAILLLYSFEPDKPMAQYQILEPVAAGRYITPYKQNFDKGFPFYIVSSIIRHLNK